MTQDKNFRELLTNKKILIDQNKKNDKDKEIMNINILLFNEILKVDENKSKQYFLEFIELSNFGAENICEGNIPKEGLILKKSQRKRYKDSCFFNFITCGLINCCDNWQKRWFILQDEMICYLKDSTSNIGKDVKFILIS